MERNYKQFIIKTIILAVMLFLVRVLFQFPVEFFGLEIFKQTLDNRLFSKIDALKVLIFVIVFFALYFKNRILSIEHPKVNIPKSIMFFITGLICIVIYYFLRFITRFYEISSGLELFLIQIGVLITLSCAFFLFILTVFQYKYIKNFYSIFKKELFAMVIITAVLYNVFMFFQSQWLLFSKIVTSILYSILNPFYSIIQTTMDATPILLIRDFALSIGAPCSGIDSILFFIAFFSALFALDHNKIKRKSYIMFFIIGLVGVFFINVLRLLLLILVGVHISQELAVGIFHTNAAWVLFVAYFFFYYRFIQKYIYRKKE